MVVIVGGGPIGLYLASQLKDYLLIEAADYLGGQLLRLYPEKEIVDIPDIKTIKAKDYVYQLISKINLNNVHLKEKVLDLRGNLVITNKGQYKADTIILANGLGFSSPRKLELADEEDCKNILYSLQDFSFLKDKKVAIFGGGDSALDWAKEISSISNSVYLVHRRTEFRGNAETIKDCKNLNILLPYIPFNLEAKGKKAKSITIQEVNTKELKTIQVDYILVNYGNIAQIDNFGFETFGAFIKVDKDMRVRPNIYAAGDVVDYEGKKRRIAAGIDEANKILYTIKKKRR